MGRIPVSFPYCITPATALTVVSVLVLEVPPIVSSPYLNGPYTAAPEVAVFLRDDSILDSLP
jgi:hypothetical protein